VITMLKEMFGT